MFWCGMAIRFWRSRFAFMPLVDALQHQQENPTSIERISVARYWWSTYQYQIIAVKSCGKRSVHASARLRVSCGVGFEFSFAEYGGFCFLQWNQLERARRGFGKSSHEIVNCRNWSVVWKHLAAELHSPNVSERSSCELSSSWSLGFATSLLGGEFRIRVAVLPPNVRLFSWLPCP